MKLAKPKQKVKTRTKRAGLKRVAILGSTGSIGESALKVLSEQNGNYKVVGLTADKNVDKLADQIRLFKPSRAGIADNSVYEKFSRDPKFAALRKQTRVAGGAQSLLEVATAQDADLVLSGVVGAAGLSALLAALRKGKTVALANKESLIMAGDLVTRTAKKYGATLLPVDSEHSAMFQCLQGQAGNKIEKIILTASGGPFYRYDKDLSGVTVEHALAHPNWIMGKKITIDSATLMNKGLEAIEAHFLFNVPLERIQIVIHPQSIIHSAIEFEDSSIIAQMSAPDMCLPIQYALTYPERKPCPIKKLDFYEMKRLDFEKPDFRKFPCLTLALDAGKKGGTAPCALSAANEIAVYSFMDHRIKFTDIARVVEHVLSKHTNQAHPDLEEILETDRRAREQAREKVRAIESAN